MFDLMYPPDAKRFIASLERMPLISGEVVAVARSKAIDAARTMPERAVVGVGIDDSLEALIVNRKPEADGRIWIPDTMPALQAEYAKLMEALPAGYRLDGSKAVRSVKGRVGVIGVYGPITQKFTMETMFFGGTSIDEISYAIDAGMADKSIGAIVFDVNSPGGSSAGVEELANKIRSLRGQKPLYCMVNAMCGSAALWCFTAANLTFITPSGSAGSVGAFAVHLNQAAALEKQGIKATIISSGKYKTELSPFGELSPEALAYAQSDLDALHGKFVDAMAANRGTTAKDVRENFGQGRMLNSSDAVKVGMCDRILSMEELIKKLTGQSSDSGARVEADRIRHQIKHDTLMRKLGAR